LNAEREVIQMRVMSMFPHIRETITDFRRDILDSEKGPISSSGSLLCVTPITASAFCIT
jgi:hypothetical protein